MLFEHVQTDKQKESQTDRQTDKNLVTCTVLQYSTYTVNVLYTVRKTKIRLGMIKQKLRTYCTKFRHLSLYSGSPSLSVATSAA